MIGERRWCPTCRSMRVIEDEFTASRMSASGEMEFWVEGLDCGHTVDGPETRVAGAPGAPYAGTQGFRSYRSFKRRWAHGGEVDV